MFPGLFYVKLAGIAALVAGAGYVAWALRGVQAEHEQRAAVESAVESIRIQLEAESKLRKHYSSLADDKLDKLLKSISTVRATQQVIATNIAAERKKNPEFYEQPLPVGGHEAWKHARAMVSPAPASAPSAPSP